MTWRGPTGPGGAGRDRGSRGGNDRAKPGGTSPGRPNGPGGTGRPLPRGRAGTEGTTSGPRRGAGSPPPDRRTGPNSRLPQDLGPADRRRPTGPQPADRTRSTGPNPRLTSDGPPRPNTRVAPPSGTRPPDNRLRRPPAGGGRRPPRPPRWLRINRGDPGRRIGIALVVIAVVLTLFAGRLVQIQGMESAAYKAKANAEQVTTIPLAAERGNIYGADGSLLAMTVETYMIWSDPQLMNAGEMPSIAAKVAGALGEPTGTVLNLLQHPTSPGYVVIAKGVSAKDQDQLATQNLPGIEWIASYSRDYPDGTATGNVVGLTNDNPSSNVINGYAGLEDEYNKLLTGTPGKETVYKGATGETIPLAGVSDTPAANGESIKTTIIPALQLEAQQACEAEVKAAKAKDCTAVVIQPKTGNILAMAQWPNDDDGTDIDVQDVFTPGSTAKVITAAAAFEHGGKTPMSAYDIPNEIYRGGQWIRDAESHAPGTRYTIAGVIANSSNIGMSQVVESVSEPLQYQYLTNFGLDRYTGLGLPGESPGILAPPSRWAGDERYTLSYGQGIDVNAVQMASVYATIANGGVRVTPRLVEGTYSSTGTYTSAKASSAKRVIQAKTAKELVQILQQVPGVDDTGAQYWGEIPNYAIAAKTGTASEPATTSLGEKACPADNPLCVYGASYIGLAPGNDPSNGVVVAVNVQDPRSSTDYFGDQVAGPVFYNVMKFALQTLKIQPQPGLVAPHVRLNAG